jgi:hypothetical protein
VAQFPTNERGHIVSARVGRKCLYPLSTSTSMLLNALSRFTQRYSDAMPSYSSSSRRIIKFFPIVVLACVVLLAFHASGSAGRHHVLSSTLSAGRQGSTLGGWPWKKPPKPRRTRVMVASSFGAHDDGECVFQPGGFSFLLQVLATRMSAVI